MFMYSGIAYISLLFSRCCICISGLKGCVVRAKPQVVSSLALPPMSRERDAEPNTSSSSGGQHPAGKIETELCPRSSSGGQHPAGKVLTFEDCQDILAKAVRATEGNRSMQEHIEALQFMLPDVMKQPSKARLRQLAKLLGVPMSADNKTLSMHLLFTNVQNGFFKCVSDQQGVGKTLSSAPEESFSSHGKRLRVSDPSELCGPSEVQLSPGCPF